MLVESRCDETVRRRPTSELQGKRRWLLLRNTINAVHNFKSAEVRKLQSAVFIMKHRG
ncbi:MAG: hypothetical protein P4M11_15900 [Candidatus Pacebacteria bacterium]|nr:hypothetical protein [Candidatus Paceibacterota bacterium]